MKRIVKLARVVGQKIERLGYPEELPDRWLLLGTGDRRAWIQRLVPQPLFVCPLLSPPRHGVRFLGGRVRFFSRWLRRLRMSM